MDFSRTVDEITPEWLTPVLRLSGFILVAICAWLFIFPLGFDLGTYHYHGYAGFGPTKGLAFASTAGVVMVAITSLILWKRSGGPSRLGNLVILISAGIALNFLNVAIDTLYSDFWPLSQLEDTVRRAGFAIIVMFSAWITMSIYRTRNSNLDSPKEKN